MFKKYGIGAVCFAPDSATASPTDSSASESKSSVSKSDFNVSIEASQGLEGISEELLMGMDSEAEAEAAKAVNTDAKAKDTKAADDKSSTKSVDTKPAAKPADEAKAKADSADAQSKDQKADKAATESKPASSESKATDAKKADTDESQKPPKGYVPIAALHEVRGEVKYLKEQIQELSKAKPSPAESKPEAKKSAVPEGFEVLTDKAFTELADEDPKEALLYMKNLGVYQEEKRQAELEEQRNLLKQRDESANKEKMQQIFADTEKKMEEFVPGLFDENSTASKELATFANDLGFTDDMYYLTNPETQIILPGETEPLLLGEQAASIIQTLATARNKINELSVKSADETKLREEITKEVEADLRKTIEAELLAKFKTGPDETAFRSLTSVPSSESPEFADKVLTMADYNKLSPEEQEAYLAGT
jgi:hypothetical protein